MSDAAELADGSESETQEFDYIEQEPAAHTALPAGEEEVLLGEAVLPDVKWEEEAVGEHLKMVGTIAHELWGKSESDWLMSERDLERMTGPLTRILNRYEPTARASVASDPILLGYGTTMYTYRSILQRRAALAAEREAAEDREHDVGAYAETAPSQGSPSANGRRDLRFPEAARGARPDEGE